MKIARFFAVILGILGLVLMLGTTVVCLTNLDTPVKLTEVPMEAAVCSEELMDALAEGDFAAASQRIYGQPDLGADREPATPEGKAIWKLYLENIRYEFKGDCYATDSGIARDATITVLQIPTLTDSLDDHARTLLTERIGAATEMAQLYDEENNFRQDLIDEVMAQALEKALAEGGETASYDVTLKLIQRDGQWWAVPDQALMKALYGGLA